MSNDVFFLIVVVVVLAIMLVFIYVKDKESMCRIEQLEKIVEDLSKQEHFLRKELEGKSGLQDYDIVLLKEELKIMLEKEINAKIAPVLSSLKNVEYIIEEFQNEQQNRILNLEQKTQNISKLSPSYENEEQKIIELFKEGKSVEQIAKDLRIGIGSVELALKFKQLLN
ncbi:DUF6115 domain-containing protein [Campylobacter sp. US33a]|uniref:DUF6115 domain-containing protein n=1 Tax=Campylobacter sp. US33a TaxID=2498120 RepID=UPI00106765A6|nr:hypothetical protein [Campylobacter sp. US33a]TEY03064.1 hypothetical protein ELQ16_03720 [Campylobacter sp. US33a]